MNNDETGLPGPLDVLLRDLHLLWCEDEDDGWHLGEADPVDAARLLSMAVWELADRAREGDVTASAALVTLISALPSD